MTDALSNEIEIGKVYGYSQNSNGITNIFIGIAKNITPTGLVSLTVLRKKVALYNEDPKPDKLSTKKTVIMPEKKHGNPQF